MKFLTQTQAPVLRFLPPLEGKNPKANIFSSSVSVHPLFNCWKVLCVFFCCSCDVMVRYVLVVGLPRWAQKHSFLVCFLKINWNFNGNELLLFHTFSITLNYTGRNTWHHITLRLQLTWMFFFLRNKWSHMFKDF